MAQEKVKDLRAKTVDQLNEELVNLRKSQFNLRFQQAGGQLENTAQFRLNRRKIATIKTILGERNRATS